MKSGYQQMRRLRWLRRRMRGVIPELVWSLALLVLLLWMVLLALTLWH